MRTSFGISALLISFALVGCGGGGSSSSPAPTSTATLRIVWPDRTRSVPFASNSIHVIVSNGGTVLGQGTVARPAGDASSVTNTSFTDLPVGTANLTFDAYPNADGTGVIQAKGAATITTVAGTPTTVTVSLTSTVSNLVIAPGTATLGRGLTRTLTASARDIDGNVVLLAAGGGEEVLTWTNSATSVATLSPTGLTASLQAIANGDTTVGVSFVKDDVGTVVTASLPISVVPATGTVIIK